MLVDKETPAASICLVVLGDRVPDLSNQTARDFEVLRNVAVGEALRRSSARYFLWLGSGERLRDHALEECIWGLRDAEWVAWADSPDTPSLSLEHGAGPLGVRRGRLEALVKKRSGRVWRLPWSCYGQADRPTPHHEWDFLDAGGPQVARRMRLRNDGNSLRPLRQILRHLENAELLSWRSWSRHPLDSVLRLVPLRVKQAINRWVGSPVFDLVFYLRFQGHVVPWDGEPLRHVDYRTPAQEGRLRVALCTLHLGHGGAETVFLQLARQFDRRHFELFLIVTRPWHYGLASRWADAVDHVYDLGRMAEPKRMREALCSLAANWHWDGFVLQNNLDAYSVVPALKQALPNLCVIDVLHNVHDDWDYFSATSAVAESIDRRVSVSRAGGQRLVSLGYPRERIRVIHNGIDLERFTRQSFEPGVLHRRLGLPVHTHVILFAGHLVDRKRPILLVDIDRELCRLGSTPPYCFVVAGEGPEFAALDSAVRSGACGDRFRLLGHVDSIAPVLADTSVLVLPSTEEGVPLVINEALAMEVPVVSSRVGAIEEAVPPACGVLIENDGREAQSFANALCELIQDTERRERLGGEGRRFVESHYDLRRARLQYRDLIEEMFPVRAESPVAGRS